MATVEDLIVDAFEECGESAPGEVLAPEDTSKGLLRLNGLLDTWSIDRFYILLIGQKKYTLTPSKGAYELGDGAADFQSTDRLSKIESAAIVLTVGPDTTRHDITSGLIAEDEWAALKDQGAVSSTPDRLYCDYNWPITRLFLYPAPRCAVKTELELGTWVTVTTFGDLTTEVNLPPGYYNAVVLSLAVEILDAYTKQPSPTLIARAQRSVMAVQRMNADRLPRGGEMMKELAGRQMATAMPGQAGPPAGQQGQSLG